MDRRRHGQTDRQKDRQTYGSNPGTCGWMDGRTERPTQEPVAAPALLQPLWLYDMFGHGHGGEELDSAGHLPGHQVGDLLSALCHLTPQSLQLLTHKHTHTQAVNSLDTRLSALQVQAEDTKT